MAKEIYVGHLSEQATEEDVWKLFSVAGTVTSVHLIIDPETREFKRCGYVRMAAGVNLDEVVETLDGAYLIDREIVVSIARPQKPGMSANKGAGKTWLKPWMKPGPKPSKTGEPASRKASGERDLKPKPKTKTADRPATGPKAPAGREQRPSARGGAAPAATGRGKRPGSGIRPPRAGK
jgi:RNA recognition motif-containing protein